MAPDTPTAIYKLEATGFPVCPTCSLCGRHPMSETGFEQAVAAPRVVAKSSIRCQFSGPFRPRPPDTTMSASAMLTWPLAFSTFSTSKLVAIGVADLSSALISFGFSDMAKELFDKPIMFTSLSRTQVLNALLVKQDRLTVRGCKDSGSPTTLEA